MARVQAKQNSTSDLYDNAESKVRYEAYSRLQAAAVAFGESLPIPEIVAIGGQSDGKSSLLEAFLGFRFNIREVEMGTRRPLIVQMVHDPTALEPRCRLQQEDSDEYGPPIYPETAVAEAIRDMTQQHLKELGGAAVSSKPIVMRAEYAYAPNLTIVDTPGFVLKARKGEPETTPEDIINMVKAQAEPPHRLILFLQQSSVEWCSSLWMHVVQAVDPHFQRTVVVASKFDNRLKEFAERWEVDRYFSATGYLPPTVKPFFVALPKDRTTLTSTEWRKAIQEVDGSVFAHLRTNIAGGFDEERFGLRIGFGNLRRFLEEELARRYRDAAPATLALLQERCESVASELVAAEAQLQAATDVASMRRAAMEHVFGVAMKIRGLLEGATEPDPAQHGFTTDEERAATHSPQWPGVGAPVTPPNAALRLYGGAAFERCIAEFQEAAKLLEFPAVARDKAANLLLAYRAKGVASNALTAQSIAASTARELLAPLLDSACLRLAAVLRHAFTLATDGASEAMRPYVSFHAALRSSYQAIVTRLEEGCRGMLQHHLQCATSQFALMMYAELGELSLGGSSGGGGGHEASGGLGFEDEEGNEENLLGEGVGEGRGGAYEREPLAESQMTVPETPSPDMAKTAAKTGARYGYGTRQVLRSFSPPRERGAHGKQPQPRGGTGRPTATGVAHTQIFSQATRLFGAIRENVSSKLAPATLKTALLEPIADSLAAKLCLELFARSDPDFMSLFSAAGALVVLEAKRDALGRRVEGLVRCKNEFQELARCL